MIEPLSPQANALVVSRLSNESQTMLHTCATCGTKTKGKDLQYAKNTTSKTLVVICKTCESRK